MLKYNLNDSQKLNRHFNGESEEISKSHYFFRDYAKIFP